MKLQDLSGQRFGRLVVIERAENVGKRTMWKCKCDCGSICIKEAHSLKIGETQSCGCLQKQVVSYTSRTHGFSKEPLYRIWLKMKERCYNPHNKSYKDYGGRGITICSSWLSDYTSFREWALENGYQKGLEIDRIDNDSEYSPINCRWANRKIQANNRRTNRFLDFNGQRKTIAQWSDISGISQSLIKARIDKLGWSITKALSTPPRG